MIPEFLIPILAGAVRNISGWATNALKDGKISKYELTLLAGTIVEVSVIALSAMYGLGLNVEEASGLGILASFALSGIKKAGTA